MGWGLGGGLPLPQRGCVWGEVQICVWPSSYRSTRHTVMSSYNHLVTIQHCTKLYKGSGPKFSGHADIKGHYQCAKFGCPKPIRGDSRCKCFFDPSVKILVKFFEIFPYFAHNDTANKWRINIGILGSIFEKISLENWKISNVAYSGKF